MKMKLGKNKIRKINLHRFFLYVYIICVYNNLQNHMFNFSVHYKEI